MENTTKNKLKPCPFCGGKAVMKGGLGGSLWWVICSKCQANTNAEYTKEKAAKWWNRRADNLPDTPTADVSPVVHAHWKPYFPDIECKISKSKYGFRCLVGGCVCSSCGGYLSASDEYTCHGDYCPNCGAKMDEEAEYVNTD